MSRCDLLPSQNLPIDWEVNVNYSIQVNTESFLKEPPCHTSKEVKEMQQWLEKRQGIFGKSLIELFMMSPVHIRDLGKYHQYQARRGTAPKGYRLVCLPYTLADLEAFASLTRGSVEKFSIEPHPSMDCELTIHNLLVEFNWELFRGIREVEIAVRPLFPIRAPNTTNSIYTTPDIQPPPINPPRQGVSLGLQMFTLKLHYPTTMTEDTSYTPVMSEMAACMLAIGGVDCEYVYQTVEGEGCKLSDWMTGCLRSEIGRVIRDREVARGWERIQMVDDDDELLIDF
jgi:hypothetical protein